MIKLKHRVSNVHHDSFNMWTLTARHEQDYKKVQAKGLAQESLPKDMMIEMRHKLEEYSSRRYQCLENIATENKDL